MSMSRRRSEFPMRTLLAILIFLSPMPALAAEPDRARDLVQALGNREYRTREEAMRELLALGRAAYPALVAGSNDKNAEVRSRSRKLLNDVFDLELKARIEAFAADTDGEQKHDLPGWERFRQMFGQERAARELYLAMVRADGRLMDAVENHPRDFG